MSVEPSNNPDRCDPVLDRAIQEGVRVEFHRVTRYLVLPVMSARLIRAEQGSLWLDDPRVIGKDTRVDAGSSYECYFKLGEELYCFQGYIEDASVRLDLNATRRTQGVRVRIPTEVRARQRRQSFRTFVFADDAPRVRLHSGGEPNPGSVPIDCFKATGTLADASGSGLSVVLDRRAKLDEALHFTHLFAGFRVPGSTTETVLLTEIRQSRLIRNDEFTRLGLMILPWPSAGYMSRETRKLDRYLTKQQRMKRAS